MIFYSHFSRSLFFWAFFNFSAVRRNSFQSQETRNGFERTLLPLLFVAVVADDYDIMMVICCTYMDYAVVVVVIAVRCCTYMGFAAAAMAALYLDLHPVCSYVCAAAACCSCCCCCALV